MNWKHISNIIETRIRKITLVNFDIGFENVDSEIDNMLTKNMFLRLNIGRHRAVYLSPGNTVIKIPVNIFGIDDNYLEANRYKNNSFPFPMARCSLIRGSVLGMEYVDTDISLKNLPMWVNNIDCGQVGYNKFNRLVAFDYAQK